MAPRLRMLRMEHASGEVLFEDGTPLSVMPCTRLGGCDEEGHCARLCRVIVLAWITINKHE